MKAILSLLAAFLIGQSALSGEIIHIPNLEVFERYVQHLDKESLVVFDVDNTILHFTDKSLSPKGMFYLRKAEEAYAGQPEKKAFFFSIIMDQAKYTLVDEKMPGIIEDLKKKNVKTIALTAMPTGRMGIIANAEQWRIEQLKSLGIQFDHSFPSLDYISFEEFAGADPNPVFKQGILASSKTPKGEVLVAFLNRMQWHPSKVLFIDDNKEFIRSVEEELEKEKIPHTSFYYTASLDGAPSFDKELADFQLNYLINNHIWLSDEEAANELHAVKSK